MMGAVGLTLCAAAAAALMGPLERAEADHAKADQVRMAQDVAGMFDELRTLADRHAEHADRARLEGELERARQDADRQRADHADAGAGSG